MKAVLAGTFDPFTDGHRDLVLRASALFGGVIVAVADDTGKNTARLDDRLEIAKLSVSDIPSAEVTAFSGLLSEFLKKNAPCVLVRGLRGVCDAEYERDLCRVYGSLCDAECVYLFSSAEKEHVSSTVVRSLASLNADLSGYVSPRACDKIKKIYGCAGKER